MKIVKVEATHPEAALVLALGGIIACRSPEGVDQMVYHEAFEPNSMPNVLREFIIAHEGGHIKENHIEKLETTTSEQRELEADAVAIRANGKWATLVAILIFPVILGARFKAVGQKQLAARMNAAWAYPEYRARVKQALFW